MARGRRRHEDHHGPVLVIATYNIHTCIGVDRRYDAHRVADVLCELNADIIALQEVDARRRGDRHHDQWSYLGEATGMFAIPGANVRDHRGRFGNALLTRRPVLGTRLVDISMPGYEPRGAIDVDVAVGNRVLRVIATHLGLHARERRWQMHRLLELMSRNPAEHGGARADAVMVLGDLNEWRGRRGAILTLDRRLGRTPAPRTFPSWCPVLPLDRIYAGTPAQLRNFHVHRSPLARIASDHLPLKAELSWSAPE